LLLAGFQPTPLKLLGAREKSSVTHRLPSTSLLALAVVALGIGCGRVELGSKRSETGAVPTETGALQRHETTPRERRSRLQRARSPLPSTLAQQPEPRPPQPRPAPAGSSGAFLAELESMVHVVAHGRGGADCLLCPGLTCRERMESCGHLWPPYMGVRSRSALFDPPIAMLLHELEEQTWADAALVGGPTIEERISDAFRTAE
jgi:hypothetical protein